MDTSHPSAQPTYELLVSGAGKTLRVILNGPLVIGRGIDADLSIPDPKLSRLHCRLEPSQGRVRIAGLGSSNGTSVAGPEISQLRLGDGDEALLGGSVKVAVHRLSGRSTPPERARPERSTKPPIPKPRSEGGQPSPSKVAASAPTSSSPRAPKRRRTARRVSAARPDSPGIPRPPATPPAAATPAGAGKEAGPVAPPLEAGPRSQRSELSPNRKSPTNLIIGFGVLLGAVIILFLARENPRLGEARQLLQNARAAQQSGDEARALKLYDDLLKRLGDTPAGRAAEKPRAALAARIEEGALCQKELSAVILEGRRSPTKQLLSQVRAIAVRHADVMDEERLAKALSRVKAYGEKRALRMVRDAREAILSDTNRGYYRLALEKISEAESSPLLFGRAATEMISLRDIVRRAARKAYGDLLVSVRSLPSEVQRQRLVAALPGFGGTSFEGELRARIALADLSPREPVAAETSGERPASVSAPSVSLLDALARAEGLASRRRFAQAAQAMKQVVESAPGDRKKALEARRQRFERIGELITDIAGQLKTNPERFRDLRLGGSLRGRLVHIDEESLVFSLGPGATARWKWERISRPRLISVLDRMRFRGPACLAASELLLELGDREACLSELARGYDSEPRWRQAMVALVAEARRLPSVPEGGFELLDGGFYTREEERAFRLRKRIDKLAKAVVEAEIGGWDQASEELLSLGEAGKEALVKGLEARSERLRAALAEVPALRPRSLAATRAKLFSDLQKGREEALALIRDKKRYPYPYGPDQAAVQAEVDRLVARVARIWRTPSAEIIASSESLSSLVQDLRAIDARLEEIGAPKKDAAETFLAAVDAKIAMPSFAPDGRTRGILEHARQVAAYNASLTKETRPKELEVLRLTNAYRLMMGLRAVMGDDRLTLCARGHSQEMQDLGYFAHTSPTEGRRSPSERARLSGWGSGVSENIARGSTEPARVLGQWLGSSGHHRNVLGARHTHLGVGMSDNERFWTQNFSTASSKPPRVKSRSKAAPGRKKKHP